MVLNELRLHLIPIYPNEVLHLKDFSICSVVVFAWARQVVNEELGCFWDVRFRLLSDVVDLSPQGDSKLTLLSLDLIK